MCEKKSQFTLKFTINDATGMVACACSNMAIGMTEKRAAEHAILAPFSILSIKNLFGGMDSRRTDIVTQQKGRCRFQQQSTIYGVFHRIGGI